MSPISGIASSWVLWSINGLLALVLTIIGWTASRECSRNDEQDRRITAVERAAVRMDFMAADIAEIKADVKALMQRRGP